MTQPTRQQTTHGRPSLPMTAFEMRERLRHARSRLSKGNAVKQAIAEMQIARPSDLARERVLH